MTKEWGELNANWTFGSIIGAFYTPFWAAYGCSRVNNEHAFGLVFVISLNIHD
jgi:hypothetical protein